ncbi:MAG: hypothetical protein A3C36_01350 [Omnitrophica WOR_2 bacterium RIFCSPHIGHO2_02_FULL_52_10]|nr:MAG: hypothetical protein A3C36_01350 [Omnitrophica WOR_2 bacterium RIFCSPHIGHO2_02_FULL_52_10]
MTESSGTTITDIALVDTTTTIQDTSTSGDASKDSQAGKSGEKGSTEGGSGKSSSGNSGGGGLALSSGDARGGSNGSVSGSSAIGGESDGSLSVQSGSTSPVSSGSVFDPGTSSGGKTQMAGTVTTSPRPGDSMMATTGFTVTELSQPDKKTLEETEVDLEGETYAELRKQLLSQGAAGSDSGSQVSGSGAGQQTGGGEKSFLDGFIEGVKQWWSDVVSWFSGLGGNG